MNLEEMKQVWEEMSNDLNQQKLTTNKLIMEMTQVKYDQKIRSISKPESIGAVICFIMAGYIILNFGKLETPIYQFSGVICLLYLTLLPFFVLRSIKRMGELNIEKYNYKELIQTFVERKNHFIQLQKLGIFLNIFFMFLILPVAGKLLRNKDIFTDAQIWIWYLPFGLIFLFFFSRWGYNYYKRTSSAAGQLLIKDDDETS